MVSRKFKEAVKLSTKRAYQIAREAGISDSALSRIMCGIDEVQPGDERVLKVGEVLGLLPEECFAIKDNSQV
jgi:transcriptional regulator with XRE-family HTH domain